MVGIDRSKVRMNLNPLLSQIRNQHLKNINTLISISTSIDLQKVETSKPRNLTLSTYKNRNNYDKWMIVFQLSMQERLTAVFSSQLLLKA